MRLPIKANGLLSFRFMLRVVATICFLHVLLVWITSGAGWWGLRWTWWSCNILNSERFPKFIHPGCRLYLSMLWVAVEGSMRNWGDSFECSFFSLMSPHWSMLLRDCIPHRVREGVVFQIGFSIRRFFSLLFAGGVRCQEKKWCP